MSETPSREEPMRKSNKEIAKEWAIDVEQDPYAMPLDKLNVAHPALFKANTMLPYFERLRAESPVNLCEESQYGPYWSVTKYADIKHVDTHEQIFSSDISKGGIRLGGAIDPNPDPTFHLPMFIMQDPPKHDEQRKAVAPTFAPAQLGGLAELIRSRAGAILDDLPENEEFNWVREVSVELTGQMLATLFDIPQEDRHLLIHWSDTVERIVDPDYFDTPEQGFQELWKCWEYFDAVWKERAGRKAPGTDLISMLAQSDATKNMPPNEYLGNILLLIVGGNDTTRNAISGGVLALHENPTERAKLRNNPDLVASMVPEIVRWQSPVAHMCRTAMVDTELGGKQIRSGDKVVMWYLSGNRDEDAIDQANAFSIDRANPRQHLSFGFGVHRCIGSRLAEMQLQIIWEEILQRFAAVEITGDPEFLRSSFIRGITHLPVTVRRH